MHSSAARREVNVTSVWKKPENRNRPPKIFRPAAFGLKYFPLCIAPTRYGGRNTGRYYSLLEFNACSTVRNRCAAHTSCSLGKRQQTKTTEPAGIPLWVQGKPALQRQALLKKRRAKARLKTENCFARFGRDVTRRKPPPRAVSSAAPNRLPIAR
jgi:hypothetical protein